MMNKKPSHYLAWGKYGLLIGILYLSSAFVAPYTVKVQEFLPPLEGIVFEARRLPDVPVEKPIEKEQNLIPAASKAIITIDSSQTVKPEKVKSKWIVEQNGTLYYAISPLATWDDINEVKKEVKRFGAEMNINAIEYDPLQMFITHLTVHIETKGGSTKATEGEGKFVPMKGESGYIGKNEMGTGGDLPSQLVTALQNDYDKALEFAKAHETEYFEYRLSQKISDQKLSSSSHGFNRESLEGKNAESIRTKEGVSKSEDNLLKLESEYSNSELYLNSQPATLTELNSLPIEKFVGIKIIKDQRGKKYVIVYTK